MGVSFEKYDKRTPKHRVLVFMRMGPDRNNAPEDKRRVNENPTSLTPSAFLNKTHCTCNLGSAYALLST